MAQSSDPGMVWVRTQPDIHGMFRLAVEVSDDESIFLDEQSALAYVTYLAQQVAFAEFDARVFAQMCAIGSVQGAAEVIGKLRERRTIPASPISLTLNPGVNPQGESFLHVLVRGSVVGQWSVDDARSHGQAVLEGVHVAKLDNQYLDLLMKDLDLDEPTARRAIHQLGD